LGLFTKRGVVVAHLERDPGASVELLEAAGRGQRLELGSRDVLPPVVVRVTSTSGDSPTTVTDSVIAG
jgi:hypothetical protein